MKKQLFSLILFIFFPQIASCADPCEYHSDDPWMPSVKANCVDIFGHPSEQKVWGEESLEYQVLDGKIEEMFGIVPYEQVMGLCDNFSHHPLKWKCQFKVREKLQQKVYEVEPSFAGQKLVDQNISVFDRVDQSFMYSRDGDESPKQVCLRNPKLQKRLEAITGMSYDGLCQEYLLAIRDRRILY
jgi:hypothetical protein